jgi:two-component system chemotaxis sensor kinase CheA
MSTDLIHEFLIESFENLANISEELTTFENNPNDSELLNSIFRKVHTLKGSAGFLGFKKLQEITHAAESLLDLLREKTLFLNQGMCDSLLEVFDTSILILKNIEKTKGEPENNYDNLVKKINSHMLAPLSVENSLEPMLSSEMTEEINLNRSARIPKGLFDDEEMSPVTLNKKDSENDLTAKNIEIKKVEKLKADENLITSVSEGGIMIDDKKSSIENTVDPENTSKTTLTDSVVRVNVQLLDKIMNVVGELVLNRNQILQYASSQESAELNKLSQQLNTITSELQADIMTTRMQPVGSVLSKFERIVRDLAKSQNKKIRLEIIGKETELDKTLLEAIRDPLTHLIRNSIDHGIEMPEVRKARGKIEEGKILIRSFHESGQVSIEIKDDGNGIDPQKIMNKAIQKGILTAEQVKTMSPKQILNIIFMPGFSTAEQVTNISGRGVGMDVVKSNVEKIGGSVDIMSVVGAGSTFKLKIPLTLAIVPALVVQDRGETFAIPQISLVELVRFDSNSDNVKLEKLYGSEFLRLRGHLIPIFRLSQNLGLEGNRSISEIVDTDSVNIVVLNAEGKTYGLVVDLILDTEEIVVKPLSKELKKLSFYAGATIMGDGKVALILDALGFYNFADKGIGQKVDKMNQEISNVNDSKNEGESQELLICELGDHRQYAIPLMFVNRLEEFQLTEIEWSGDQALVKYGNIPMPLINIESSLNLRGENLLLSTDKNKNHNVPCVVIKIRNHLYGLVVNDIIDIQQTDSAIHSDSVDRKGLLGTVFLKNRTITILDVHNILESQTISKGIFQKKSSSKVLGQILLVEDSPLYMKVQKDFLEEEGYEVLTAKNGVEAFDLLLSNNTIQLMITDIEMPEMNGWELTEKVRASGAKFSRIPIIAVSSKHSNLDKDKGVKSGFNEQVEKMDRLALQKKITEYI